MGVYVPQILLVDVEYSSEKHDHTILRSLRMDKYIEWLSGAAVAIVALLVLAGFIRLSMSNTEYLFLIFAAGGAGSYLYSRLH